MIKKLDFISETVSKIPCSNCGGRVQEFSIPGEVWNDVIRHHGKETHNEYLCIWCFTSAFVRWYADTMPAPRRGKPNVTI
jgi:hypothetical protein